jgi:hypothetical protein
MTTCSIESNQYANGAAANRCQWDLLTIIIIIITPLPLLHRPGEALPELLRKFWKLLDGRHGHVPQQPHLPPPSRL